MTYPQQPPDPTVAFAPPPLQYGPGQPPPNPAQPTFAAQYGPPAPALAPAPAPRSPQQRAQAAVGIWGALAIIGVVCGISIPEDSSSAWGSVHAWGALAILGAVLTVVPAVASSLSLPEHRAWQIAVGGAAILVFYWILLVLPAVGSNMSLVTTLGVACGCIAAAAAPGRPTTATPAPPMTTPAADRGGQAPPTP